MTKLSELQERIDYLQAENERLEDEIEQFERHFDKSHLKSLKCLNRNCRKEYKPKGLCPDCIRKTIKPRELICKSKRCGKKFKHQSVGRPPDFCSDCRPKLNAERVKKQKADYKAKIAHDPTAYAKKLEAEEMLRHQGVNVPRRGTPPGTIRKPSVRNGPK